MNTPVGRALVVEDDRSWQQILGEILADCGLTVDTAGNLEDALFLIKDYSHRLAVVDLSLSPDDHTNYDGLRVLDAVRRHDPGCRTILLTGFATVELAVSVLTDYNAFTFLRKETFRRADFRENVDRALASAPPSPDPELAAVKATHPPLEEAAAAGPSGGNVLVVEDDAGWRSILTELLADDGYQVRLCSSFGEALGCLRRERFNLAVIDLSLAGSFTGDWASSSDARSLDGYQLLARTRAGGIPTIVVSGVASAEDIQRAYSEQSIFAFLEKQTFDRPSFRRAIREASTAGSQPGELAQLTGREREVLELLAHGLTNKEISEKLVITPNTVKRHLKAIFEKLEVHTRSAAAAKALGDGRPR